MNNTQLLKVIKTMIDIQKNENDDIEIEQGIQQPPKSEIIRDLKHWLDERDIRKSYLQQNKPIS